MNCKTRQQLSLSRVSQAGGVALLASFAVETQGKGGRAEPTAAHVEGLA